VIPARLLSGLATALLLATPAGAHHAPVSAPISHVAYRVSYDSATARQRMLGIRMTFDVAGPGDVLLSLPSWTPGAYEVSNYARWVTGFAVEGNGRPLRWDKIDYDTWRIRPAGTKQVTVSFNYLADSLDNAIAWSRPDFVFFNGTNVFLYPEGRGKSFPATVAIQTEPEWRVATGMRPGAAPGTYAEKNYHDLVDMPFFVGRFDYDSLKVGDKWARLASYPAGQLAAGARDSLWHDIERMIPVEAAVFGEAPWDSYTTLIVFDSTRGGGSALEHQNSHLALYATRLIGNPIIAAVTAHEMFHSWNVKRLRPAEMVPYRYDVAEPTPWLWVSEGITDYYADLTLVRSGIVDSTGFLEATGEKIATVDEAPPAALVDASLSTWIHPTDGTAYLYYPKGSLAGLMLDIMIRDASDNRQSLDGVMRFVYRSTFKQGRGFTGADWWSAASRAAGGRNFGDFSARYVEGRESYPWDTVLPLAGLRYRADTSMVPRLGVSTQQDSGGVRVTTVAPGSASEAAGVEVGDVLLSLGDFPVTTNDFGPGFRQHFAGQENTDLPITLRRMGRTMTLPGKVRLVTQVMYRVEADPAAGPKAARIRRGLLTGTTDTRESPGR